LLRNRWPLSAETSSLFAPRHASGRRGLVWRLRSVSSRCLPHTCMCGDRQCGDTIGTLRACDGSTPHSASGISGNGLDRLRPRDASSVSAPVDTVFHKRWNTVASRVPGILRGFCDSLYSISASAERSSSRACSSRVLAAAIRRSWSARWALVQR
jgi:hypothetical protein